MNTATKQIMFLFSTILLLTACSHNQVEKTSLTAKKQQALKLEAKKAIKTVAGALQKTLNQKVKEGGLTNAATFCSTNAMHLAQEVSQTLPVGVKVRRVTDKPRNALNQANDEQLAILDEIKEKLSRGVDIDMLVKEKSSNHYQVYKPIKMVSKCLFCHGSQKVRNPNSYTIISQKYPDDKAIDYNLDDLRGMFLVDILK
jgi:hypothetical protein